MATEVAVVDRSDAADWDEAVWQQPNANIYASRFWGSYKGRLGWSVRRIALRDSGGDLAYVQYQERKRGFLRRIFVQGGPILTARGRARAEAVLAAFLDHLALGPADVLAIKHYQFHDAEGVSALLAHNFLPVITRQDHTIEIDLSRGTKAILADANSTWRQTIRKAQANPALTSVVPTDPEERLRAFDAFAGLHADLQQRKGFADGLDTAVYRDLAVADPHLLILEIREDGAPVTVCLAHTARQRWTYFFAASNDRARATGAAPFALWRIVEHACEQGARVLDLGGVDPIDNRGVFDFKRGLCRNIVQGGPLWLYARHRRIRTGAATLLTLRGG
ncbi:lipid II:glycine glycyltransferase FemX [Methylorubrum zatmanii]